MRITSICPRVLVLAAGAGSRMGCPKISAKILGKTFGEHIAATIAAINWPSTWALRSADQAAFVRGRLPSVHIVFNPEGDMFSSVTAALQSGAREEAFCIWPVDFPCVQPQTLLTLAEFLPLHDAVFPCREGQSGHPLLVRRHQLARWVSELPAGGLREAAGRISCRLHAAPALDPACFSNLNTPADVRAFEALF